jgi:tetratricopeptide (TPR) repeat protein
MRGIFVVVALAGWLGGVAFAQDVGKARELFVSGSKHFDLGEYEQALADFKEAYRVKDDPVLLYNIAQCHRLLKHDEEALRAYKSFLHRAPESPVRPEVEQRIIALEQSIEAQKKASTMPPDRVLGKPAQPTPAQPEPLVTPATPAVTASAPPPKQPVYKKWWLWTAVGVVAAAGVGVGLGVGLSSHGTSGNTLPAVTW